jgi:hypothetical protein
MTFSGKGKDMKWCKTCCPKGFWSIAWKYGISKPQHDAMIEACENRCEVCRKPPSAKKSNDKRLCIDHCHRTGRVRGLLCHTCNQMLGFLENHGDRMNALAAYLEKHEFTSF